MIGQDVILLQFTVALTEYESAMGYKHQIEPWYDSCDQNTTIGQIRQEQNHYFVMICTRQASSRLVACARFEIKPEKSFENVAYLICKEYKNKQYHFVSF